MNTQTNLKTREKLVYKPTLNPREKRKLWISRIFIWVSIIVILYPIVSVVAASFSKGDSFYSLSIFPGAKDFTLENYKSLFSGEPGQADFLTWFKNSLILCTSVAIAQLLMTATGSYAFSRLRFKGRKYGLMGLLLLQMFPMMMALSAIYKIMYMTGLQDNIWALVLILSGGSAYNIWLLKGYFDSLPRELDEAAMVDGASHWQVFWKIIMPLARPMLAVIFLFSFIGTYSEFIISSTALKSPENYTIAVGLQTFINNAFAAHWTQFAAAAVLATLPITIINVSLQKFVEKGLVAGAVKG